MLISAIPGNANEHCDIQWDAHLSSRENPLILKDDGDFGERKSEIVRYDAPKEVLEAFSPCALLHVVGILTFRTSSTLTGKGTNIACFPLPAFASALGQHWSFKSEIAKPTQDLTNACRNREYLAEISRCNSVTARREKHTIARRMEWSSHPIALYLNRVNHRRQTEMNAMIVKAMMMFFVSWPRSSFCNAASCSGDSSGGAPAMMQTVIAAGRSSRSMD